MNSRDPKAGHPTTARCALLALLELELPQNSEFEAFEEQLDAQLVALEERFSQYVTRHSFCGSLGR